MGSDGTIAMGRPNGVIGWSLEYGQAVQRPAASDICSAEVAVICRYATGAKETRYGMSSCQKYAESPGVRKGRLLHRRGGNQRILHRAGRNPLERARLSNFQLSLLGLLGGAAEVVS